MKTPEDEAFDELATRQGDWGGGFPAKRAMAADKLQEPAREALNVSATVFVYRHYKDKTIKAKYYSEAKLLEDSADWEHIATINPRMWIECHYAEVEALAQPVQEPPSEWAGIKAILDEYGLQAIDFVADFKAALAQPPLPVQPERQPLKLGELWSIFTRSGLSQFYQLDGVVQYKYEKCIEEFARAIEAKIKEKNG